MIGVIIQARMGSSRLPGKVMMKITEKDTVLSFLIQQLSYCKLIDKIVIATTDLREDDLIVKQASDMSVECFRGDALDVLDRYYFCAKKFMFSDIVRITSDCPLIDPQIVDNVIRIFKSNSYDYVTNSLNRTFPYGTETEAFSFNVLKKTWKNARKPSEREHVTPYIYNHKDLFRIFNVENAENISHLSWTIDRINDLKLVQNIVLKIKNRPILLDDILDLIKKEPELLNINKERIPNEGYLKSLQNDENYTK